MNWFSPHDIHRRIGSLIEVSATEAKINLSKAGTGEQSWILGSRLAVGEVNEFVFIDCGQFSILGRMVKVWLENGERLSVDKLDDAQIHNHPIGLVQLLVTVDVQTGYNYQGIKQYPRLGAQVYAAHPQLISLLAKGSLNKTTDDLQLTIAEMPHDASIAITVSPEKMFARHCAILGSTGGGKSYTMANLMENVLAHGGKILLLDATGEYAKLDCTCYVVGEDSTSSDEKVTYPHWQFTDSDLRALLRPSAQSQAPKLEEAVRSLKIVANENTNIIDGLSIDTNGVLEKSGKPKLPFEQAVQLLSDGFQPWSFSSLSKQIISECVWPTGGSAQCPNPSIWGSASPNDVGYCLNLISRVSSMSSNIYLKWMLDCDDSLKTIPNVIDELATTQNSQIVRLDLSNVPFEANAREILVNAICRKLLSVARDGKITHENPLLVFIDEAHQFLDKGIGDETSRFELDAFGNIAKEGRKYGLNVVIATQRPRDIPEDVLSQIGTLIVHRLTNEKDQEVVKKAVGAIDQRSASFLPTLGQGEALLLGIDFPFPMTVKMKKPNNRPDSNSAFFSRAWRKKI